MGRQVMTEWTPTAGSPAVYRETLVHVIHVDTDSSSAWITGRPQEIARLAELSDPSARLRQFARDVRMNILDLLHGPEYAPFWPDDLAGLKVLFEQVAAWQTMEQEQTS
jgi:hypothetical protein